MHTNYCDYPLNEDDLYLHNLLAARVSYYLRQAKERSEIKLLPKYFYLAWYNIDAWL